MSTSSSPGDPGSRKFLTLSDLIVRWRGDAFALERMADERPPVMSLGIAIDPTLDLLQVCRQVVAQVNLGGRAGGQEHMMKGGADAKIEHRFIRLRFPYGVDEERDGPVFVRLDDTVVVPQVVTRHPVGIEGGIGGPVPTAQTSSHDTSKPVLIGGGAEVCSPQEDYGFVRGDGVGEKGDAESADIVRRLLRELGADVTDRGRDLAGARAPGSGLDEIVCRLREYVRAGAGSLEQHPVRPVGSPAVPNPTAHRCRPGTEAGPCGRNPAGCATRREGCLQPWRSRPVRMSTRQSR